MKLSEAFSLFMFEKQVAGQKASTIETYTVTINDIFIPFVGDIDTFELELKSIQNFIIATRNRVSQNTVISYWRHVKAFIKYMYREELINYDYTVKIPPMKSYRVLKEIYFDDEIQLIFTSIQGNSTTAWQKRAIFALLIDTGIRGSELCNIELDDLNLKHKYLTIRGSKSHADRGVPLSMATVKILSKYLMKRKEPYNSDNTNLLFSSVNYDRITIRTLRSYVQTHVKSQGISKGTVHLFRHTFITRKCLETKDAFMIQAYAGHSDLKTTQGYFQYASNLKIAKISLLPIGNLLATLKL